jgi:hypothetical protein
MTTEATRGGIVLRVDGALVFVPASIALKVASIPTVARIAGAPPELLGIGLQEGEIIPVISIGPARETMVVCTYAGEPFGVVGGEVLESGLLPSSGEGDVLHHGEIARALDLGSIWARVRAAGWTARFGT